MPWPNPMCPRSVRVTSNTSARSNLAGSRFAEAMDSITMSPAGMTVSPTVRSVTAKRGSGMATGAS